MTFPDYVAMYVTKKVPVTANITWTLIPVIYHSDGQTHGPVPGEFGKDAHVQARPPNVPQAGPDI